MGGVPDVDKRFLKFWRINSLGTIASISRTPPMRHIDDFLGKIDIAKEEFSSQ